MQNYFFTILPDDIQIYIFQLRLSMYLEKNYFRKLSQKEALMKYITNNQNYDGVYTNIFNKNTENYTYVTYIDPYNKKTMFLANKLLNLLTDSNDKIWWMIQFIRPLERGLILYKDWYYFINFDIQHNTCFYKTEASYFKLMNKLNIKHNSLIFNF